MKIDEAHSGVGFMLQHIFSDQMREQGVLFAAESLFEGILHRVKVSPIEGSIVVEKSLWIHSGA